MFISCSLQDPSTEMCDVSDTVVGSLESETSQSLAPVLWQIRVLVKEHINVAM